MRPTPVSILRMLADGRPHVVAALAAAAHAAPGDIDGALDALSAAGAVLQRGGDGTVRLDSPVDLLDAGAIEAVLGAARAPVRLALVDQCDSTNAALMAQAAQGLPHGSALACELQTAGRGRRGNAWVAPVGGSLAFSLLWRMPRGGPALGGLPLAAGVACVRALERCGAHGATLKWPNDLVHAGRKLGGILIEATPDGAGTAVVCGVGLNTRLTEAGRARIGQPVTDVAAIAPASPTRSALLAALLLELAAALERFAAHGFAAFREDWLSRHAHQGMRVRVTQAGAREAEGRAVGVDEYGALLVESAGRVERFHSGEVSLRAAA